jgi:hypothetical protein
LNLKKEISDKTIIIKTERIEEKVTSTKTSIQRLQKEPEEVQEE